jgi:hypothetical protein
MNRFRVVRVVLIGLAVLAGVVLALSLGVRLYGAQRLRSESARFEREVGPLNLLTFVRPRVPVEENVVTWLRPGILAVVLFPNERAVVGKLSGSPASTWTKDELATLELLIERNGPAFEILGRARGLTASNWDLEYEKGNATKLPDLLAAMNAGKLVAARGRLALGRGDREAALASAEVLGALARSHELENLTIMLLIGSSLERLQLGLIREIVTSPEADGRELDRIEASLSGVDLARAFRETLRGDAAAMRQDVEGQEFQDLMPRAIPRSLAVGVAKLMVAGAIEARRVVEPTLFGPVKAPIDDPGETYRNASWWERLKAVYGPHIRSAAARGTATTSARELARLAIVLRRDALASGSYSATFVTPTDPLTGEAFAFAMSGSGVELRSTTRPDILKSIFPLGATLSQSLYVWTLPSASRSTTPSPSPAGRRG